MPHLYPLNVYQSAAAFWRVSVSIHQVINSLPKENYCCSLVDLKPFFSFQKVQIHLQRGNPYLSSNTETQLDVHSHSLGLCGSLHSCQSVETAVWCLPPSVVPQYSFKDMTSQGSLEGRGVMNDSSRHHTYPVWGGWCWGVSGNVQVWPTVVWFLNNGTGMCQVLRRCCLFVGGRFGRLT